MRASRWVGDKRGEEAVICRVAKTISSWKLSPSSVLQISKREYATDREFCVGRATTDPAALPGGSNQGVDQDQRDQHD